METTNPYFVYGASGHGLVIAEIIEALGHTFGGFIDDNPSSGALSWEAFCTSHTQANIIIGIGNNTTRQKIFNKIDEKGYHLPSVVHPCAIVSPSAMIQRGVVVMAGVVVNAKALIQEGAILNTSCVIEHECVIGSYAHISPKVALAGAVHVGAMSHIGIGASVIQGVKIGENTTIGAGGVVINDIPSNVTAVGVPVKIIKGNK